MNKQAIAIITKAFLANGAKGSHDPSKTRRAADEVLISAGEHLKGMRTVNYNTVEKLEAAMKEEGR